MAIQPTAHCDLDGRDRAVRLFQNHISLQTGGGAEVVKRRARIGPGKLFAQFAHHQAPQQPPQERAIFG